MVLVVFAAVGLGVGSVVPVDVGQQLGKDPDLDAMLHVDIGFGMLMGVAETCAVLALK